MIPMTRAETEQAARAVVRHLVAGRDQALQISPAKLAEIAAANGLGADLPPLSAGMDHLWRDHLRRTLGGRPWKVGRRFWRIRCPQGRNFHFTPVSKPWNAGR